MSTATLTSDERNMLLELSYHNVGRDRPPLGSLSFSEMLQKMKENSSPDQQKSLAVFEQDMKAHPERYPNLKDLELVRYRNENDTTGFVGYELQDSNGGTVVLFRGTEGIGKDLADDIKMGVGLGSDQKESARKFFKAVKDDKDNPPGPICLMGHSLGGYLAAMIFTENYGDLSLTSWILNAPWFGDDDERLGSGRIHIVTTVCDAWVSHGLKPMPDRYIDQSIDDSEKNTWNPLGSHTPMKDSDFRDKLRKGHPKVLGSSGIPISADPQVLAQMSSRMGIAIGRFSEFERSVDRIGRLILTDALDLSRDGDVKKALGRSGAIAMISPPLAALLLPFAARIMAGLTFISIEKTIHFDRHTSSRRMQAIQTYLRRTSDLLDKAEHENRAAAAELP